MCPLVRICSDLEQAVEDLSGLLESPIEADTIADLRQKVTDKTVRPFTRPTFPRTIPFDHSAPFVNFCDFHQVYVHKRNEIMLEETARDYQDGRVFWNSRSPLLHTCVLHSPLDPESIVDDISIFPLF